jgi:23S rRNA (adenine2503-C2)-methyltransferase
VRSIAQMSDLPKAVRDKIHDAYVLRWTDVAERSQSFDGTVKYLFRLQDGATIESVYIPETARRTICISTRRAAR